MRINLETITQGAIDLAIKAGLNVWRSQETTAIIAPDNCFLMLNQETTVGEIADFINLYGDINA